MSEGELVPADADAARRLFRYVTADEWRDYRAIMGVFAGTSFAEFTPDDVATRLSAAGVAIESSVVVDRLEALRGWGNLTVSTSVGSPSSLADYYKRRNRYLITAVAQEVHALVEGVLTRVDEVRDVSTSRLRALRDALDRLDALDAATVDPVVLGDAVREVFDPHEAFTSEITQFFAAINQWQARYDLSPDEFRFFAEVLVSYVAERLEEIDRTSRPIGHRISALQHKVPTIVDRVAGGLAARVERAGLTDAIAVTRLSGSGVDDWAHLATWFVSRPGAPSRIERLGRDAVAAIRTLTLNLTRLSRSGVGASSRRADFLRLARFFADAPASGDPTMPHRVATAAFGLFPARHLGTLAADADDPSSPATSWWDASRALVPVSIRERGDRADRGRASPMADRTYDQELVRLRRRQEVEARRRVDHELLDLPAVDGATLSPAGLQRMQQLLGRTTHRLGSEDRHVSVTDGAIRCTVRRVEGATTTVGSPDGRLTLVGITVELASADPQVPGGRDQHALAESRTSDG